MKRSAAREGAQSLWSRARTHVIGGADGGAVVPVAAASDLGDDKDGIVHKAQPQQPQQPQAQQPAEEACAQNDFAPGAHPRLILLGPSGARVLPVESLRVEVKVHLSVAFVHIAGVWTFDKAIDKAPAGFVLELPKRHTTTVTSMSAMLASGTVFEAHVVEQTAALAGYKSNEGRGMALAMQMYRERSGYDATQYNPEMFCFPFHGAKVGERIRLDMDLIENMTFDSGSYSLSLPLSLSEFTLAGKGMNEVLDVSVEMHLPALAQEEDETQDRPPIWHASGMRLAEVAGDASDARLLRLQLDKSEPTRPCELRLGYLSWSTGISCQALIDARPRMQLENGVVRQVDGGVISAFVAPPRPSESLRRHPRDIVFILDRSGSMGFTDVFPYARQALIAALRELGPEDRFAICCFDDRQIWFGGCCPDPSDEEVERVAQRIGDGSAAILSQSGEGKVHLGTASSSTRAILVDEVGDKAGAAPDEVEDMARASPVCVRAKPEYVERAIKWVQGVEPAGLTDILKPLRQAFWGLFNSDEEIAAADQRLKSIFLITDGAVENEREICRFAARISHKARLFTFGIGVDCNAYFLRKLASVGRGYSDVCFLHSTLVPQMVALFSHARMAVLRDVRVRLVCADGGTEAGEVLAGASLESLEWRPEVAPDLYCHAPMIVSCSYDGVLPAGLALRITGMRPGGEAFSEIVPLSTNSGVPLRKVFAQQTVEALVASAWLADVSSDAGAALRDQCVGLAVAESIPCPFTQTVTVELTKSEAEAVRASGDGPEEQRLKFDWRKHRNVLLVGGAAASAIAFGSIAATLAGGTATSMAADAAAGVGAEAAGDGCCACDNCECVECLELCS